MLELAQGGIEERDSEAHLTYLQGDLEIYPQDNLKRVLPDHLSEVIKEGGDPDELNNLDFSITQEAPSRRVDIRIGPGEWTMYRVESDDQTWAFGRYHELTDKLLKDRSLWAKFRSTSPEVLRDGADDKWRSAAWEPVNDWRITLTGVIAIFAWIVPLIEAITVATFVVNYHSHGRTKIDISNREQATSVIHWAGANKVIIIGLTLSYLVGLVAWGRWFKTLLKSGVMLRKASLLSQFNFNSKKADSVVLASFYVSFFTLIFTTLTLLIR
jgi:hypothetical protein